MDFETLVYLILVIGYFLFRFFNKKKTEQKPAPQRQEQPRSAPEEQQEQQGDPFRDIFKELKKEFELEEPEETPPPAMEETAEPETMTYETAEPDITASRETLVRQTRPLGKTATSPSISTAPEKEEETKKKIDLEEAVIYDAIFNRPYH